ncbi:MAG: homocysteine S-methyltransferase family protein [Calditrichaeota bacterium]|nr:MAG: homocysteine S-methyltransferase family protein [Calditrichota bacterium]
MTFTDTLQSADIILTEGGMVERIRRAETVELDPFIAHAGLIYQPEGRRVLAKIFRQYIDLGKKYNFPFLNLSPTWRANPERLEKSNYRKYKAINRDCVRFLQDIRRRYGDYGEKIFIGGLMGCRGDAYRPEEALARKEAADFHAWQASELADSGVDFIKVATLPALSEAIGIAEAIASLKIPYILSFVIHPTGTLLDGTPLSQAIEEIDSQIRPAPDCFMVNCVHPTIFTQAVEDKINCDKKAIQRIQGLQANTSAKSPEELDELEYLDSSEPTDFGRLMAAIHEKYRIKIIGGCCGSDERHIEAICENLIQER